MVGSKAAFQRVKNLLNLSGDFLQLCVDIIINRNSSTLNNCRNLPDKLRKFLIHASPV